MAYNKTNWKDRVIQRPNTFRLQNNTDGTVTLIPVPGTVTEQGTPVNASNLNKIENELVGLESSLAETETQVFNSRSQTYQATKANGKRRCIVSFISDDGYDSDYLILKSIFQPLGIPCGMALVPGYPNQITDEHFAEAKAMGWDFSSHTVSHPHLATLIDEEIEYQLRESKKSIESERGIECEYIVYPFGEHDERVRKIASKYYKFGLQTGASVTEYPVKNYMISRVGLGASFDAPTKNTLEYYKSKFDEAYAKDVWIIYMLHAYQTDFDATQQQHLRDTIAYIQSFNVPIMTVTEAYKEFGNMVSVGDGKTVITNAGDVIETTASYSKELENTASAFKAGTGIGQTIPVDFVNECPVRINVKATSAMTNPSIVSVGKNLWSGLKFANDIIKAINDSNYAWYQVVDGRRCLALKGSNVLLKRLFTNGFLPNTRYTISGQSRRDATATGNGGTMKFEYTDGTFSGVQAAASTAWTDFVYGTDAGKTVKSIYGNYGSNGNIAYYDIDTIQLEAGASNSVFEKYKETRLDITADIVADDVLSFENNKLYKNAEKVPFLSNLKAYKNGTMYVSDNSSPVVKVIYPLNNKAVQDLIKNQFVSQ